MIHNTVPLEYGRVYLFTAPAKISARVNHDLLVVFSLPVHKSAAAVHFNLESSPAELVSLLDMMLDKLTHDLRYPKNSISLKAFGLSNPNVAVLNALRQWAKENEVTISAEDVGRYVTRNILIDCETGRVGVGYAESIVPELSGMLDAGSAHTRDESTIRYSVLVLGLSKVKRQLCRQAVEEKRGFRALAPTKPYDVLLKPATQFTGDAILIVDEIGAEKPAEHWLKSLKALNPNLPIIFVGEKKKGKEGHFLPEPTPETMSGFKRELNSFLDQMTRTPSSPSQVLTFKRKA